MFTVYIFPAILAFSIFLGTLIRPLKPIVVVINPDTSETTLKPEEDSIMDFSMFRIPPLQHPDMFSFTSRSRSVAPDAAVPPAYPTIAQMTDDLNTFVPLQFCFPGR